VRRSFGFIAFASADAPVFGPFAANWVGIWVGEEIAKAHLSESSLDSVSSKEVPPPRRDPRSCEVGLSSAGRYRLRQDNLGIAMASGAVSLRLLPKMLAQACQQLIGRYFKSVGHVGMGGINDLGQVAFTDIGGTSGRIGYLRDANGTFTPITFPGATFTSLSAINNAGVITGVYGSPSGSNFGFIRNANGTFSDLAPFSQTLDINNQGVSVGPQGSGSSGYARDAAGNVTLFSFPGSFLTDPLGINDQGQIAGEYCPTSVCGSTVKPFFRDVNGTFTDFGLPAGEFFIDINNGGQMLLSTPGGILLRSADGTLNTLVVPGGGSVLDLANNGRVFGIFPNGTAFIGSVSPEPGKWWFMGSGFATLAWFHRRRALTFGVRARKSL
jgi:hypothetical protein